MFSIITRLNIYYAVHTLSQFMQQPKRSYLEASYSVVRYLKGSVGQGIWMKSHENADLPVGVILIGLHALTLEGLSLGM